MSRALVTARSVYEEHRGRLELGWLAGRDGAGRPLVAENGAADPRSLIGHLNFIHPHRIQVIGATEADYLAALGKNSFQDAIESLCSGTSSLLILAEGVAPPSDLVELADGRGVPILGSPLSAERLIEHLNFYLSNALADKVVVHGVFMDVMGIGVLLTGAAAVGKSELALELVTLGHRLVADDAPEFVRIGPDTLMGRCPPVLKDFLEVRGLGVLNIRAMFGDNAVKPEKALRLIVHLENVREGEFAGVDRLRGSRRSRRLLEVEVPEIRLPVAPGRNLAVLVEAAARAHILYHKGYDAAEDFIARQQALMEHDDRQP